MTAKEVKLLRAKWRAANFLAWGRDSCIGWFTVVQVYKLNTRAPYFVCIWGISWMCVHVCIPMHQMWGPVGYLPPHFLPYFWGRVFPKTWSSSVGCICSDWPMSPKLLRSSLLSAGIVGTSSCTWVLIWVLGIQTPHTPNVSKLSFRSISSNFKEQSNL